MGYRFDIHHDLRLVYKKVWGSYGDAQSRVAHIEWDEICRQGDEVGDYNEFQDLTEVTEYGVSLDQIKGLAERYDIEWQTQTHQPKQIAYVVPTPLSYGTGRVYGSLMGHTGIDFKVFDSLFDAAVWLELSPAETERVVGRRCSQVTRDDPDDFLVTHR